MASPEGILSGNIPKGARAFLIDALTYLRIKGARSVKIPAAGGFDLVSCAITAGFTPESIKVFDESFVSCLVGCIASGEPLSTLGFTVHTQIALHGSTAYQLADRYESAASDAAKAAVLLWAQSIMRLDPNKQFDRIIYEDLISGRERYITRLREQVELIVSGCKGIKFKALDFRSAISTEGGDVFVVAPPTRRLSKTKAPEWASIVSWSSPARPFDYKKDFMPVFEKLVDAGTSSLWLRKDSADGFTPEQVVFGCQASKVGFDYILSSKPDELSELPCLRGIDRKKGKVSEPYPLPVWGFKDELTPNSSVRFVKVDGGVSLYYRDLWAHRLGQTASAVHYLIIIDGKIYGTVAFFMSDVFSRKSDRVFETYGFNAPSDLYRNFNRLLMQLITCHEMGDVLMATTAQKNRLWTITGLKTICLERYRNGTRNAGILQRTFREKLPNGMYRIVYETDWHPMTFSQVIGSYLQWEAENHDVKRKAGSGEME